MSDSKSFLITGGAGFLGIKLVRYLLERGHRVTSLYFADFDYPDVKDRSAIIKGDIRDRALVFGLHADELVCAPAARVPVDHANESADILTVRVGHDDRRDPAVIVVDGGAVGANLEAVGAMLYVIDGQIGDRFDAYAGTSIIMEGGSIGQHSYAGPGTSLYILGGQVASGFIADGSSVIISGGHFAGFAALGDTLRQLAAFPAGKRSPL